MADPVPAAAAPVPEVDPNAVFYANATNPSDQTLAGPAPTIAPAQNVQTGLDHNRVNEGVNNSANAYVATPGGGSGRDFTTARQYQALNAAMGGTSGGEGDTAMRDRLRQAIGAQLDAQPGAQDTARGQLTAGLDRGLNNSVSTLRRQLGGSGMMGSQQAGSAFGNIVGQEQDARAKGLSDLNQQGLQNLSLLNQNEGNLVQQSLAERGYNLNQGMSLANLLQQQAGLEQGSIIATRQPIDEGPSDFEKGIGYGLQAYGIGNSSANKAMSSGGGMMAAMSDENLKEGIRSADSAIEEFLDSVTPYEYLYKDQKYGEGKHVSVMAQDLEKTNLGKGLVINTKEGKMVDYGKAFGLMLASNIHLHQEIKKLKGMIYEQR